MPAKQFVSVGVKALDENGNMVAHSTATMIPIDPTKLGWTGEVAGMIAGILPMLQQQATSPIAVLDPKMRLSTAAILENIAKELRRSGTDDTPQVYHRLDGESLEIRTLLPLKKAEAPAPSKPARKRKP